MVYNICNWECDWYTVQRSSAGGEARVEASAGAAEAGAA